MTQPPSAHAEAPIFELETVGLKARGRPQPNGNFLVLAGSQVRAKVVDSFDNRVPSGYRAHRQRLLDEGVLQPDAETGELVLNRDELFNGTTEAGCVVAGRMSNGLIDWATQLPDGTRLTHGQWLGRHPNAATLVDGHFPFAQFREDAQQFTDDRVKGNMVLDRKYAPLLLDLLGGVSVSNLQPGRSPYTGKAQLAVKVSLGGGVKMDGSSFGRALLLPEDGYEYVPLPQGLTLEVGLPDGKGDRPREALSQAEMRGQLLEALFAPVPTVMPPSLTLNSDFGMVGLQPLTGAERSNGEALLDTYISGTGKSRRMRVGLTLTPAELEGENFAEVLEGAVSYIDRLTGLLDILSPPDAPSPETKVIQPVQKNSAQPTPEPTAPAAFVPIPGVPLNQILYGPPGTGKTYRVVDRALAILDPAFLDTKPSRAQRKARYDELAAQGHITFVTFHQSFGYEDFVEGIKPLMKDGQLSYELEDGLFLRAVEAASGGQPQAEASAVNIGLNPSGQVWRIYIDGTAPVSEVRRRSLEKGEVRVGSWGASVRDLSNESVEALSGQKLSFRDGIRAGDLVLLATGADKIGGVGIVTSDYFFDDSEAIFTGDYAHARKVNWLTTNLQASAQDTVGKIFSNQTVQRVLGVTPAEVLERLHLNPTAHPQSRLPTAHVLIIDEINRGNVAKVFGELITLLEPSKRDGAAESLTVRLPLSKRPLSVPRSLYVIGTMNTADRSLTLLDAALRRRFVFEPIWPEPEILPVISIDGYSLDLPQFLRAMNARIEKLLSREQVIGHAYFLDVPETLEGVAQALQQRILPLLEEYFFEDWGQIRKVLGDDQKPVKQQFIQEMVDGDTKRYERNREAFSDVEAYIRSYSGTSEVTGEE